MKFLLRTWWARVNLPWHLIQAHESYNFRLKGLPPADSKQIHYYSHVVVVLAFATSALLMASLAQVEKFLDQKFWAWKNHIFVVYSKTFDCLTLQSESTALVTHRWSLLSIFQALQAAVLSSSGKRCFVSQLSWGERRASARLMRITEPWTRAEKPTSKTSSYQNWTFPLL